MRYYLLSASACIVVLAPVVAFAQTSCECALRTVLTNTAKEGLLAARACYDTDTIKGPEFVAASRRLLEAKSGRLFSGPYDATTAKEHLQVADQARRRADVSKELDASIADFDYQIARAIVAASDRKVRPIWEANIMELSRLQGNWIEVPSPDARRNDATGNHPQDHEYLRFYGGIVHLRSSDGSGACAFVTLSSGLSPAHIDLHGFNGDFVYAVSGVYRVDGDTLQLAFGRGPDDRRKDFQKKSAPDGTPIVVVHTYRRLQGEPPVRGG